MLCSSCCLLRTGSVCGVLVARRASPGWTSVRGRTPKQTGALWGWRFPPLGVYWEPWRCRSWRWAGTSNQDIKERAWRRQSNLPHRLLTLVSLKRPWSLAFRMYLATTKSWIAFHTLHLNYTRAVWQNWLFYIQWRKRNKNNKKK